MKKFSGLVVFLFVLSFVCSAKTDMFSGMPYKSATWKSKTTVESPQETISFEQTVYLKGKKMRNEGKFLNRATNEKENQIIIIDEKNMYSINPDKKQGMKYPLESPNNPAASENEIYKCRDSAKKTGSDKINNIKCGKYEYSCKIGNSQVKITEYRNDKDFAIRTITKMDKTITTVDITDLKINASVPDSKFVPDEEIQFMDMDKIMGANLKKMMQTEEKSKNKKTNNTKKTSEESENADEAAGKMMKDMMKGMLGE